MRKSLSCDTPSGRNAIDPELAKIVKARYYGEISYLDHCLGRILDAIEARPSRDNVLICFFSDHGDLLGDHHGWQKQNFSRPPAVSHCF